MSSIKIKMNCSGGSSAVAAVWSLHFRQVIKHKKCSSGPLTSPSEHLTSFLVSARATDLLETDEGGSD